MKNNRIWPDFIPRWLPHHSQTPNDCLSKKSFIGCTNEFIQSKIAKTICLKASFRCRKLNIFSENNIRFLEITVPVNGRRYEL